MFGKTEKDDSGMDFFYVEPSMTGEDVVARCPKDVYKRDLEEWKNTLIGNYLGRRPSFAFIRDSVKKIWKLKSSVEVTMLETGLFIFRFSCSKDKHKVLEGGVWQIA